MKVGLLGPLELEAGTLSLSPRDRLVLAALAVRRGQWLSAESLADALWHEQPPASWVKVVQGCVSRLRRVLGAEAIETSTSGYRLRIDLVDLDVVEFEELFGRARSASAEGAAERAVISFEKALGLWRGRPLTDLEEWEPAQLEAARLTELLLAAQEERLAAALAAGRHHQVVGEAMVQAREQPWRESRWVTLALAQYRCGRQADALASIRSARRILGQQLGLDPGSELAGLERAILEQDPTLAPGHEARAASVDCPWRGLASYDAEDVDTFFGREDDVLSCLARLDESPLLVLAGPSGSGKSSLMKAGVVPALQLRGWSSVTCTPGADPIASIAEARTRATGVETALCVDQAEEALAAGGDDVVAWLRVLADHLSGRGPVILTLRADYLPTLAIDPEFARLAERGVYLVSPMDQPRLRRVIEEPARVAGLHLEHGLVDLMLRDAEDQPGALPLLSHALAETWRRREGTLLTVEGYRDSGGIAGAVAASADRVYSDLSATQREQLRWLMLRMAGLAEAGEPVRTPVERDVGLSDPDRARVLDLLVRTRLVTSGHGSFELAHEALVRAWPRLRGWLEEDREGQRVWRHLAAAATEWQRLDRPGSELYTGVRLEAAVDWAARPESMPTVLEQEFLHASEEHAARERLALEAQAHRERAQNRRLRMLLTGLALVLVAAVVASVLAVLQARRADRQTISATAAAVGSKALKTDDPQLSLLLAAAAQQLSPTADTLRSLSQVIAGRPLLSRVATVPDSDDIGVVVTTTDRVFTIDRRHVVRAYDSELHPVGSSDLGDGHRVTIDPPLAANDDVLVAAAAPGDPRQIRLLDPETLDELPNQLRDTPTDAYLVDLSISADGRRLAVAYSPATAEHPVVQDVNNSIRVWDLTTGLPAGPAIELASPWNGAALSPDGSTVYSSTPVAAYDVASGDKQWDSDVWTWNNAMDVNGDRLATGTGDGTPGILIFDARTGDQAMTLPGDTGSIQDLAFSRDGKKVLANGFTGRIIVWRTGSGRILETLDSGAALPLGGAFSADGRTVYVAKPLRQQLQAWRLDGSERFVAQRGPRIPSHENGESRLSGDGTRLALAGWKDSALEHLSLTLVDLSDGEVRDVPVIGSEWLGAGAWAPSGDQYAAGYGDGWVQVVDAESATETDRRRVSGEGVVALSYAGPDRIVAATEGGTMLLLDAATLDDVGTTVALPEDVAGLAGFSDGHSVVALGGGDSAQVTWATGGRTYYRVDLDTGEVVHTGRLNVRHGLTLALAPDEQRLAVGGVAGEVEIIDLRSGEAIRPAVTDGAGDTYSIAFTADGDRLVTGSRGRALGLWDARSGTPLAAAELEEGFPPAVAFEPDGRIVVARLNGSIYTWDVSAAAAVDYACRVAGRDLTRQEWSDAFGGDVPYRRTCPDYPAAS
ncbi:MAG TPA: hypothetical protein DEQ43_19020 [Nocardioides bacterium]|uniref:nSTAND1 domain-containing NTPase n=1 Tax=uncultured Nocardioides sp. TaxID=198441 RepID=UPI000EEB2614|nr:BTAD domain-containing putative transcriptional regulator [uncultured Nocardioides sp.]HCB06297.1 hypothetical protein [Nocardioides sp.]